MNYSQGLLALFLLLFILLASSTAYAVKPSGDYSKSDSLDNSAILKQNEAFYDSLEAKSDRNWFFRSIYSIVFKTDNPDDAIRVDDPSFKRWKGKPIRSIKTLSLNVFPPDSTSHSIIRFVGKLGNKIHINTHEWVLKENLFFHEGEQIIPETMRWNLVYLRKLKYVNNAQILVVSTKTVPDSADVIVVIQDKFSIKPGISIGSQSQFQVNIDDQNFLGMGQQLSTEWHVDTEIEGSLGWKLLYRVPNIHGSFFQGELGWANLLGYSLTSIKVNHPFLFPIKRFAGGMDITKTHVWAPVDTIEVDKIVLGGWYGHILQGFPGPANQYAYVALSGVQSWYHLRPDVDISHGKLWHESLLALGVLALTESDIRYLPYVYTILENDNLPVGYLLQLLVGHEFGEFRAREFLGFQGTWGTILNNGDFLYLKGGIESFICKTGLEQGVLHLEPLYISPLQRFGRFRARTFYRARLILGNKRFPEESLSLSTDSYFRGNRDLSSTDLIAFGVEEDVIAPWDILGFHFSIFAFFDVAVVRNTLLSPNADNQIYTEGLGIRIRNPRLVLSSVEINVAMNQGKGHFDSPIFGISVKVPLTLLDFEGGRPSPYSFQ